MRRPIRHREESDVSKEEYDEEYSDSEDEEGLLQAFVLPEHHLRFALIVGALTGILMIAIHFMVPFLDVAAFQKAAIA